MHDLTSSANLSAVREAKKCLQIKSMVYSYLTFPYIIRESLCSE